MRHHQALAAGLESRFIKRPLITIASGMEACGRGRLKIQIEVSFIEVRFSIQGYLQAIEPGASIARVKRAEVNVCHIGSHREIDFITFPVCSSACASVFHV